MKIIFNLICFLFFLFSGHAQQVQWASKIIKMPSDLGGKQYGVKRLLGKPDVFPQAGYSPNAWSPKNAMNSKEIVEVGFDNPQTVKQIAVFENLNCGSVISIAVADSNGKYTEVWTRKLNFELPKFNFVIFPKKVHHKRRKRVAVQEPTDVSFNPGIERVFLENPISNIVSIRVKFNFELNLGQKQIDAIGISDSDTPIEAKINTTATFENLSEPQTINIGQLEGYSPNVSSDGKKLYFSADFYSNPETDEHETKIFSLTRNTAGVWIDPKEESTNLNTNPRYNYLQANHENFMVRGGAPVAIGKQESGFEILENKPDFKIIESVKVIGFNNYDEGADITITDDRKMIMLALESDFSQGGSDIYFTTRKDDGTYNLLQNAGKIINSAADEVSLQLLSDQKTLLFSSDGFSGYGNFDIYVTHRLDETWKNWSEPINIGSKINTKSYEGSHFYDEKTEILYYSSFENNKKVIKKINIPFQTIIGK